MLADYARLRITRHPVWPYHPRMWDLRRNLGAYDAAYIALAEALGCELLTGNVKLKAPTMRAIAERFGIRSFEYTDTSRTIHGGGEQAKPYLIGISAAQASERPVR